MVAPAPLSDLVALCYKACIILTRPRLCFEPHFLIILLSECLQLNILDTSLSLQENVPHDVILVSKSDA